MRNSVWWLNFAQGDNEQYPKKSDDKSQIWHGCSLFLCLLPSGYVNAVRYSGEGENIGTRRGVVGSLELVVIFL